MLAVRCSYGGFDLDVVISKKIRGKVPNCETLQPPLQILRIPFLWWRIIAISTRNFSLLAFVSSHNSLDSSTTSAARIIPSQTLGEPEIQLGWCCPTICFSNNGWNPDV